MPQPHPAHAAAIAHLAAAHPPFAPLIARVPPPPPPGPRLEPYEALIRAIAHQQLHGNAARAILARFATLFQPPPAFPTPSEIAARPDPDLRACGFSASKIAAIRDICAHALRGNIPSAAQSEALDDETLIARLIPIRGVGRWTVEMMLMTALDRPDILPVDDFGVREGWRRLNALETRPRPRDLAALGTTWSPYRSTAAFYLWRAAEEGKPVKQS